MSAWSGSEEDFEKARALVKEKNPNVNTEAGEIVAAQTGSPSPGPSARFTAPGRAAVRAPDWRALPTPLVNTEDPDAATFTVSAAALRQSITPQALLGRVSSVARVLAWGTAPLAMVAGGALGSALGLRTAMWIGAIGAEPNIAPSMMRPI